MKNNLFDGMEALERQSTPSIIADRIRQRIIDGSFSSGTQLNEAQLADALGVSRGPVREAMQRLIQEGLLQNMRHRGVFVVELDGGDVVDIYLARRAIERAALSVLAKRRDEEAFSRLEQIVDEMDQAAERAEWADVAALDLRFHECLVESAGSKRLSRMFRTLLAETRMCLTELEASYLVWRDLVNEHRALVDTLRKGDQAALLALLEEHLESAVRALEEHHAAAGELDAVQARQTS